MQFDRGCSIDLIGRPGDWLRGGLGYRMLDETTVRMNRLGARSIITVEGTKQLFFEIEGRIAPDRLLMALKFLQLLNGWPSIVTDNAGKFAQRIVIG
ncbi:hypothetical protein EKH55_1300 [Sinorhizobium alkalisoli]|nr:hypothetical protein EKH55_1300 [Sinorhizobium alkalisoli]